MLQPLDSSWTTRIPPWLRPSLWPFKGTKPVSILPFTSEKSSSIHDEAPETLFRTAEAVHSSGTPRGPPNPARTTHIVAAGDDDEPQDTAGPNSHIASRFFQSTVDVLYRDRMLNILLVLVPTGIALHFAHVHAVASFVVNAVAIIPLANLLCMATESISKHIGSTGGALLNISMGNSVEFIIIVLALKKGELRIVQASIIGSILANLLFIFGLSVVIGGYHYSEQVYNKSVSGQNAINLSLCVCAIIIPTGFYSAFKEEDKGLADKRMLLFSRAISVILLIVYGFQLLFQLKTHRHLYVGVSQHPLDDEVLPGLAPNVFNEASDSSSSDSDSDDSITFKGPSARIKRAIRGCRRRNNSDESPAVNNPKTPRDNTPFGSTEPSGNVDSSVEAEEETIVTENACASGLTTSVTKLDRKERKRQRKEKWNEKRARRHAARKSRQQQQLYAETDEARADPARQLAEQGQSASLNDTTANGVFRTISSRSRATIVAYPPYTERLSEETAKSEEMSKRSAVILLGVSTALVATCAYGLVESIEEVTKDGRVSEAFVGLIVVPVIGNAAEHFTAVRMAQLNKMDITIGICIGSAIQVSAFLLPAVVLIAWAMGINLTLYFTLVEVMCVFASTFIINFLIQDGKTNYMEGVVMIAAYSIIIAMACLYPDSSQLSALG